MSEATTATPAKAAKAKPEVTKVKMNSGRECAFTGKTKLNKDYEIDANKGVVTASFDFRNGQELVFSTGIDDMDMLLTLAGHGIIQKGGDETSKVKPAVPGGEVAVEDMAVAVESVLTRLANTAASLTERWYAERSEGDGFSGASVVMQAILEATNVAAEAAGKDPKDMAWVKAWLEKKLEAGKAEGLTRQKLYNSYRKPGTKTAAIIARIEQERLAAQATSIDADADIEAAAAA